MYTQLLPGPFTVSVTLDGFKKFEQEGIVLSASERLMLNPISLQVGRAGEVVQVEANMAPLQTESAENPTLLDSRQLRELPLKGRDYLGLLQLLPGSWIP